MAVDVYGGDGRLCVYIAYLYHSLHFLLPVMWVVIGVLYSQYTHDYLMGSQIYSRKVIWPPDRHGQWGMK